MKNIDIYQLMVWYWELFKWYTGNRCAAATAWFVILDDYLQYEYIWQFNCFDICSRWVRRALYLMRSPEDFAGDSVLHDWTNCWCKSKWCLSVPLVEILAHAPSASEQLFHKLLQLVEGHPLSLCSRESTGYSLGQALSNVLSAVAFPELLDPFHKPSSQIHWLML